MQLLVQQRFYIKPHAARGDRHDRGSLTRFIPPEVAACFDTVCAAEVAQSSTEARAWRRGQRSGPNQAPAAMAPALLRP